MYTDQVYRLQVEFCEILQLLAHPLKLESREKLNRRRMEIIAEASDLVHKLEISDPIRRVPARPSPVLESVGASSK